MRSAWWGIAAAVLFGLSTPLSKALVGDVDPLVLAALLYWGSGLGLTVLSGTRRVSAAERLTRRDLPWLGGAILAGGVAAPIVLLVSLRSTPAATASLLLNFESVATTVIAALVFREVVRATTWGAVASITLAAVLLSWQSGADGWGFTPGALGIVGACVLWGMDNNLTRQIAARDPVQLAMVKGWVAGSISFALALLRGAALPAPLTALAALGVGAVAYGGSLVLFIFSLRALGAARTSALFSTAPAFGVLGALLLLRETPSWMVLPAAALMVVGVGGLSREGRTHAHGVHAHWHRHTDGFHGHVHDMPVRTLWGWHRHPHSHE